MDLWIFIRPQHVENPMAFDPSPFIDASPQALSQFYVGKNDNCRKISGEHGKFMTIVMTGGTMTVLTGKIWKDRDKTTLKKDTCRKKGRVMQDVLTETNSQHSQFPRS